MDAHSQIDSRSPRQRSRVTNGKSLFQFGDGRTAFARRFRDLVTAHIDDLGGADTMSAAQLSLARRAATLEVQLEYAEDELASGGELDLAAYAAASGALHRILKSLGLERKARAEPSLAEYLAATYSAPEGASGRTAGGKTRKSRTLTGDSPKPTTGQIQDAL